MEMHAKTTDASNRTYYGVNHLGYILKSIFCYTKNYTSIIINVAILVASVSTNYMNTLFHCFLQYSHGDQNKSLALTNKKCHVAAYGKAVIGMVTAVESVLGDRIESSIASIPTNILQELKKHGRR